jgi:hypothetical protein
MVLDALTANGIAERHGEGPGVSNLPGAFSFGHRHRTAGARVPGKTSEYPDDSW